MLKEELIKAAAKIPSSPSRWRPEIFAAAFGEPFGKPARQKLKISGIFPMQANIPRLFR
ncbi:hypothetical protein V1226_24385 [Lachnospiraceae bacterium JLR.KK009]|nr:hypothetical protein [Lachnospiraceae bacterium]